MSQEAILCSHCGVQQLKPDARFCHQCGQPILIAQPAQPTQSPATTPTAPQGVSQLAPSAREDSSQPIFKATSPRQQRAALWLILLVIVMVAAATLAVFFARQRGREEPLTRFGSVPQASARPAQGTEGPVQKTVTMRPSTPVPTPTPAATLSPEDQFTQTARETFGSSYLMEARLRDGYGIDGTGLGGWVKVRSGNEVSASYAFESVPIIVELFKGMAMFVPKVFQQNPKLINEHFHS